MKSRYVYIIIPVITLIVGCAGPVSVSLVRQTDFTPRSTITVVGGEYDPLAVQGKIEHMLISRGFDVVSEAVARDRLKYEDEIENNGLGRSRAEASVERVEEVSSAYILRFSYAYRDDIPQGKVFSSFSASIVELETGKVVATADFSQGGFGGKSITAVLREFVDKLTKLLIS